MDIAMAETVTLTDHEAIRDWVAARGGAPAMVDTSTPGLDEPPMLRLVFEQQAYPDVDSPLDAGGLQVVEWDDWFKAFDEQGMVMIVANDPPGRLAIDYQIIKD